MTIHIYDHASPFNPNGYYIVVGGEVIGVAQCCDCADSGDRAGAAIDGDEWEPISYHHETDTPVHCDSCDALIFTALTPDGKEYVRDAIASGDGTEAVLQAWATAWPALVEPRESN